MPALDPILQITGGNEHRFSTLLRKYGYSGLLEFVPEETLFARHDGVFYDHLGSYLRLLRSEAPRMGYYYFDRLSPQIADAVHDKKIKLLLDQSAETIPLVRKDESFKMDLASIYSDLDAAGMDPARIMILNANLKAQNTHDRVCDELSLPNRMKFLSYDYFLFYSYLCFEKRLPTEEALKARVSTAERTKLQGKRRTKTFLCQNRKPKDFRSAIVAFLLLRELDKKSYISYMGPSVDAKYGETERFIRSVANSLRGYLEDEDDVRKGMSLLLERTPMTLDKGIETTVPDLAFDFSDQQTYQDSYISVATETLFSKGEILFPTEKSLKPIIYLQPFIVVGDPGQLQRLRDHGFRTFSPLIDESYDDVLDPKLRMGKIFAEVERIGKMSPSQVHDLYCESWDILIHNFYHFAHNVRGIFRATLKGTLVPGILGWADQNPTPRRSVADISWTSGQKENQ